MEIKFRYRGCNSAKNLKSPDLDEIGFDFKVISLSLP